jgi:hypothetical protein
MSKHFITINDENLYIDIVEYCKLNNEKVNNFCQRVLKEQLAIEKYGDIPFGKLVENNVQWKSNPESSCEPEGFEKTKECMDKIESTNIVVEPKETVEPEFSKEEVEVIKKKKIRRL